MADMSLADLLSAPNGTGGIEWQKGQIPPDVLRYQLMIEAERARQAREGQQGGDSILPTDAQAYLFNNYGDAQPSPPPVEGLRLPQTPAPKDPVGQGVTAADWLMFQGWVPGRTAQQPGEPYMGPLPPTPATMPADLRSRKAPSNEPAKKPAKRPKEHRAKPAPATKIGRSQSGNNFIVGKIYRNAQGQRLRFQADGTFKKV